MTAAQASTWQSASGTARFGAHANLLPSVPAWLGPEDLLINPDSDASRVEIVLDARLAEVAMLMRSVVRIAVPDNIHVRGSVRMQIPPAAAYAIARHYRENEYVYFNMEPVWEADRFDRNGDPLYDDDPLYEINEVGGGEISQPDVYLLIVR